MNKDYQPIPMRPLTMRGVFGITWAVTKRANYERRALYGNVHAHIRPKLHLFSAF